MKDVIIPEEKKEIVKDSLELDFELSSQYEMGILTYDEYIHQKDILWSTAGRRVADEIMDHKDQDQSASRDGRLRCARYSRTGCPDGGYSRTDGRSLRTHH